MIHDKKKANTKLILDSPVEVQLQVYILKNLVCSWPSFSLVCLIDVKTCTSSQVFFSHLQPESRKAFLQSKKVLNEFIFIVLY